MAPCKDGIVHMIAVFIVVASLLLGAWIVVQVTDALLVALGLPAAGDLLWLAVLVAWMLRAAYDDGVKKAQNK